MWPQTLIQQGQDGSIARGEGRCEHSKKANNQYVESLQVDNEMCDASLAMRYCHEKTTCRQLIKNYWPGLRWSVTLKSNGETIMEKKVQQGILQGDLKLLATDEDIMKAVVEEVQKFFEVVELEVYSAKSATDNEIYDDKAML
ncbi:unnamed protein product [Thelazia callipaeda]|uniref:Gag-pol polyprotein n=1 Tax=Thelazia callipaeda TaxID=103827 RepID=A0A0N5D6H3_THECL|nr:unnamed protein product [Thelazia callipaeda]